MSEKRERNRSLVLNLLNVEIRVTDILTVDEADLTNEFAAQAALYGWISNLVSDAESQLARAKHNKDVEYAKAYDYIRKKHAETSVKVTEARLRADVQLDAEYLDACDDLLAAEKTYKLLKAVGESLKMRADMLISMGAHMRAESNMTGMNIGKLEDNVKKAVK